MSDLNFSHKNMLDDYLNRVGQKAETAYLLGIARDGEEPHRTLIFYDNAVDAVNEYNLYKDWGFAKDYLTVTLYEPNGRITTKTLYRPKGGESSFVRKNYYEVATSLLNVKNFIPEEIYFELVENIANSFGKDNRRFDYVRFFKNAQCLILREVTEK